MLITGLIKKARVHKESSAYSSRNYNAIEPFLLECKMYFFEMNFPFGQLEICRSFLGKSPKFNIGAMRRGLGLESVQLIWSPESEEQHFPHYSNNSGSLPNHSERLFWTPTETTAPRGREEPSPVWRDRAKVFVPYIPRNGSTILTEAARDTLGRAAQGI